MTVQSDFDQGSSRRSRPRILEAARSLACGLQDGPMTMEAIAASAGVTRRTLYNHFANLSDLCMAACAPMLDHCKALLPSGSHPVRSMRERMHALASDIIGFHRDPVHVLLKRATKLQSLSAPELRQAYCTRIREPLECLVALRLTGIMSEQDAADILATLEAVNRLDYLVRDLERAGTSSVVVDMLLDRVCPPFQQERRAA